MLTTSSAILVSLLIVACGASYFRGVLPHPLTLGGALAGVLMSLLFPQDLHVTSSWEAAKLSITGLLAGLLIAWALLEISKRFWGRIEMRFAPAVPWKVFQPHEELPPVVVIGDMQAAWDQVFARASDRLIMDCEFLQISEHGFDQVQAIISMETVTARTSRDEQTFALENVTELSGTTTRVQIPREVIGFGLVLLFAMIGTFVGPAGALWVMGGSAILMTAVAGLYALSSRQGGIGRLEMAPFILIACVSYLLLRHFAVL